MIGRKLNRSTGQQIPELLHERRFTRKSSESAIAAEALVNNAGWDKERDGSRHEVIRHREHTEREGSADLARLTDCCYATSDVSSVGFFW
jgi:hypothetical protein